MNSIYEHIQLADGKERFKKVHAAFTRASRFIHSKKGFTAEDLLHKEVKPLIDETFSVLKEAIDTGIKTEIPAVMLNKMQQDVFLFSGMKTYTQLKEASLLLRDGAGKIKSEAKFISDIKKIDSSYNENYLRAERQYAIAASQSAAQYHEYMQDADRYDLQIRTAADDKVRAPHAALHNVTRPADDSYWNNVWTPFDWGCRCRIIQVIKGKYTVTDIDTAKEASNKAVPALFRFNPGKQQIIFPPKHPYYPQHCNGEKLNLTGLIGFAKWLLDAEGDRCKAMQVVKRMAKASNNFNSSEERKWGKENLQGRIFNNNSIGKFTITGNGIKEFTNQPFKYPKLKQYIWRNLEEVLNNANYIGVTDLKHPIVSHIFEITRNKQTGWLIVHEYPNVEVKKVYSISDSKKVKKEQKNS